MSITPDEAAEVAAKHGLGLPDARALVNLADDLEHAERLAARFAKVDQTPADDDGSDALVQAISAKVGQRAGAPTALPLNGPALTDHVKRALGGGETQ